MRTFQLVVIISLGLLLGLTASSTIATLRYQQLMAQRVTLPVEIVVPPMWTQCIVMESGMLRCETMEPREWEKRAKGTVL